MNWVTVYLETIFAEEVDTQERLYYMTKTLVLLGSSTGLEV